MAEGPREDSEVVEFEGSYDVAEGEVSDDEEWDDELVGASTCAVCGAAQAPWVYDVPPLPAGSALQVARHWALCVDCHEAVRAGDSQELCARARSGPTDDLGVDVWAVLEVAALSAG